jgi:hypothetical protein
MSATGLNALTLLFNRSDRNKRTKEVGSKMKKLGFVTVVVSGLAAAVLGFAAPAQASTVATAPIAASYPSGVDHLDRLNDIQPNVNVPDVDTSVRSSP